MNNETQIAKQSLIKCILIGLILTLPSAMAFGSPNPKLSLKIASYSCLFVIPLSIVATTVTILTQDLKYLSLNLLPIGGIIVAIATGILLE